MKTIEEIYQGLAAEFQSRTGTAAGSSGDLAARFYAVAAQLYSLSVQAEWTLRQCFPQTAAEDALDRHAMLRGITRRQAAKAAGTVRFFVDGGRQTSTEVRSGTVCMTADGRRFVTTAAGVAPAGAEQLELPVEAAEPGAAGNAAAGTIVYLAVPPVGVTACTNPAALSNGQDTEEDEALRERVLASYRRLANGANAVFYEQEAMAFGGVAAVTVLPRSRGVGTVDVVVAAPGGMPDAALLAALQAHFEQVREIAVDVQVLAPTAQSVNVSAELTAAAGYSFGQVAEAAKAAVRGWFTGERLGRPVLRAELTALLFGVDGVANCTVTAPSEDMEADSVTLPVLGTLSVTEG